MTFNLNKHDLELIREALNDLFEVDPSSWDAGQILTLSAMFKGTEAVLTTNEPAP